MINILSIISSVLGITTALVSLFGFFKRINSKYKIFLFVLLLLFTSMTTVLWIKLDKQKDQEKLNLILKQDAHSVAESIIISGWEETGEYVGYLTQITSFYSRHKDKFPTEYETYKKQLDYWIDYLKKQRENGNIIQGYSSELTELRGLVSSGERRLEQISK